MRSLRVRFALLTLISCVLLAFLLGAMSVYALMAQAKNDASANLNVTCALEAARIDEALDDIEDGVDVEGSMFEHLMRENGV